MRQPDMTLLLPSYVTPSTDKNSEGKDHWETYDIFNIYDSESFFFGAAVCQDEALKYGFHDLMVY